MSSSFRVRQQGALGRVTRQLSALIVDVARGPIRFSSWNFELILFSAFFEEGIFGHSDDFFFGRFGVLFASPAGIKTSAEGFEVLLVAICFSSWNFFTSAEGFEVVRGAASGSYLLFQRWFGGLGAGGWGLRGLEAAGGLGLGRGLGKAGQNRRAFLEILDRKRPEEARKARK